MAKRTDLDLSKNSVRKARLGDEECARLDRAVVTIPAKDWEAFEAWIGRPAKAIPELKKLAGKAPTWQS